MAFADGAVNESAYKAKLKRLKKEETELLRCRHGFDLTELAEVVSLGIRIDMVKEVLSNGSLLINDYGVFGELGNIPVLNALDKDNDNMIAGEMAEKPPFSFEMTDMVTGTRNISHGSGEYIDLGARRKVIEKNRRAILQFFDIKIIVYPQRVEINGMIPTQILGIISKEEKKTAPIINSPSFGKGGGGCFSRPNQPMP
jgi:hypothetical protein